MGISPSKKIDEILKTSSTFRAAVEASFDECLVLSHHKLPGLKAYQLLDAAERIFQKLTIGEDKEWLNFREKWLPRSPSQFDVDRAVREEELFSSDRIVVDLDNFRLFATTLFKNMALTTECYSLGMFIPVSVAVVLGARWIYRKLQRISNV